MRKLIALIMVIINITIMSSMPSHVNASNSTEQYSRAIGVLCSLGILTGYEDGDFRSESIVTRTEFVTMVLRLLKLNDTAQSYVGNTKFSDISEDYWGAGYVHLSSELGFVNGYEDGSFKGDTAISYNETVKIAVLILGYDIAAQEKGGYPYGYLVQAAELGLLEGISPSDEFNRGMAAALLFNCLEVELLEPLYTLSEAYSFKLGGKTLLENLSVKRIQQVLNGTHYATIESTQVLNENQVLLGKDKFETTLKSLEDYIGLSLLCYVDDNAAYTPQLYYAEPIDRNNDITVAAEDIMESTTLDSFEYEVNGRKSAIMLPNDLIILYNGEILTTAHTNAKYLKPAQGSVTLRTFNENSNTLAIIHESEDYVAQVVNQNKVYDVFGKTLDLSPATNAQSILIIKDGEQISLEDVKKNDILSVERSLSGKHIQIRISNNVVLGTIDEIENPKQHEYRYLVGTEAYKFSPEYTIAYDTSNPKLYKLKLGDSAELHLNVYGYIAYSTLAQEHITTLKYAYVTDISYTDTVSGAFEIELLTQDNRLDMFTAPNDKKLRLGMVENGEYTVKTRTMRELWDALTKNGSAIRQIIQYGANEDNVLTELYTADTVVNHDYLSVDLARTGLIYGAGVLEQRYIADSNTVVFSIPNEGRYKELFSASVAPEYFNNNNRYNMTLYDIKNLRVGAIVTTSTIDRYVTPEDGQEIIIDKVNSPIMLIENVKLITTEDNITYMAIEGYVGKKQVRALVSNTLSSMAQTQKDLVPGNIVQYQENQLLLERAQTSQHDKVIVVYNILHDCNDQSIRPYQLWNGVEIYGLYSGLGTAFGVVDMATLPNISVKLNRLGETDVLVPFTLTGGSAVLHYNRAAKKVDVMEQEDVHVGQAVFVRQRYNSVREVIIIE